MTSNQQAIAALAKVLKSSVGNLPLFEGIFPDGMAPIVRNTADGRELAMARWGLPSNPENLAGKNYDKGITNVRRPYIPHWQPYLGIEHRCVVPATSFAEPDQASGSLKDHWFALDDTRPLFFFAGLWVPRWTSVRKVKEGPTTNDLYAFLTTRANAEVEAVHPKAMPVILRTAAEIDLWLTAPWAIAKDMQAKLPDGALTVVATGRKKDGPHLVAEAAHSPPPPPAQGTLF